jgi:predicted ATPase
VAAYTEQGNRAWAPLFRGLLAELEAEGQGVEAALTLVHEALGLAGETGEHWTDAFLHRMRGEILLKRDPANTAPAEEAFLTAIAIFGLLLGLLAVATYQNYSNVGDIVDKEASSHIRAIF